MTDLRRYRPPLRRGINYITLYRKEQPKPENLRPLKGGGIWRFAETDRHGGGTGRIAVTEGLLPLGGPDKKQRGE